MLERLSSYFSLAHRYRSTNKVLVRKAILDKGMPELLAKTGHPKLRGAILRFIKENTDEQSTGTEGA